MAIIGLSRSRVALLAANLVFAVAGCGLLWHNEIALKGSGDDFETNGRRSHDYFIFGYLILWVSHVFTARVRYPARVPFPSPRRRARSEL